MLLYIVRKNNYLIQKEFPLLKLNTCLLPTVQAKKNQQYIYWNISLDFFFQQIPCLNCPAPNSNFKKNLHFLQEFPSKIDSVTLIVLHGSEHVCIHRKPQSLFVPGRLNVTRANL